MSPAASSDESRLIAFWRLRLAENQHEYRHGSPHLRWLRWTYIRVYRFLLSQYGEGDAAEATAAPAAVAPLEQETAAPAAIGSVSSRMPLVDNTPDHFGRPPKSPGKMQAVLKDIHNANARDERPGPLAAGLPADAWLAVASRRERWKPRPCVRYLRNHGIPARSVSRSGELTIEVPREALGTAATLLHQNRDRLTYNKASRSPRTVASLFVLSILVGAALGFVIGCVVGAGWVQREGDPGAGLEILVFFTALGVLMGLLNAAISLGVTRSPRK